MAVWPSSGAPIQPVAAAATATNISSWVFIALSSLVEIESVPYQGSLL